VEGRIVSPGLQSEVEHAPAHDECPEALKSSSCTSVSRPVVPPSRNIQAYGNDSCIFDPFGPVKTGQPSSVRWRPSNLTDAAVGQLEVRLPSLAVLRHLAFCLEALAVFGNSEHHTLGKAGLIA
jgi:hypothetical protein